MARGFGYRTPSLIMLCTHFFNHFNQALRRFSLWVEQGGPKRGGGGTSVGGGPSQQLHYYCSHDFESLPSEVGEMNEFSVGGNHTHLSTYRSTTAPSAPPTCHLFSVGKCGLLLLGKQERRGNACAMAYALPVRDSHQSAQQLFSFVALTNATLLFSFPRSLSGLGGYSNLSTIAGSGSLNPPGSDNCRAWLCFFKESKN